MKKSLSVILMLAMLLSAASLFSPAITAETTEIIIPHSSLSAKDVPKYSGEISIEINDNYPEFYVQDLCTQEFFSYSEFDKLGRSGVAMACIGYKTMPTSQRGEIGDIKPSGWQTVRYDDIIEDRYLYNRCHIIGYQLGGENANPQNLITGTRHFNVEGMLPFESQVAEYVKGTKNHVLYRVTPIYEGNNLVALGTQIEAYSVEDIGKGICFNVFVYNVQPGIIINYKDGSSKTDPNFVPAIDGAAAAAAGLITLTDTTPEDAADDQSRSAAPEEPTYILNTNSHKFHYPWCSSVDDIKEKNKKDFFGTRDEVIALGYEPCKRCKP